MSERLRTSTTTTRAVDPRREQLTGGGAASAFHGDDGGEIPILFTCSYGKTRPSILGAMETGSSVLI